ncbi:MAG: hypothetical protein ABIP75_16400 [Pyrinomonadaceae bacterium]
MVQFKRTLGFYSGEIHLGARHAFGARSAGKDARAPGYAIGVGIIAGYLSRWPATNIALRGKFV